MGAAGRPYWTPERVILWGLLAAVAGGLFGPHFLAAFRPPPDRLLDFSQEWLSARNHLAGRPVYSDQNRALELNSDYRAANPADMLAWNAHPPASILLALPFAGPDYPDAHRAWNLTGFALFAGSLAVVVRGLRLPVVGWSLFPAVALLVTCHPVVETLLQGQLNFLLAALLTGAWAADRADRPAVAGALIGLAAANKVFPGFVFVYFLFARRWTALGTGAATVLAVNAAAAGLFGADAFRTYATEVLPTVFGYQASWLNQSPTGLLARLFDPHRQERVIPLVHSPLAAAAGIWAVRLMTIGLTAAAARRAGPGDRDRAWAVAVTGMLVASPITWSHYFVLLALPVAVVWLRLAGRARWLLPPVLFLLWAPVRLVPILAWGAAAADSMMQLRNVWLTPSENLAVVSVQTYALVTLFVLTVGVSRAGREPAPGSAVSVGGAAGRP